MEFNTLKILVGVFEKIELYKVGDEHSSLAQHNKLYINGKCMKSSHLFI